MTIAIGTSSHNQRKPFGADVSVEGGGLGSYTRSSPRSIGVSSIVFTTYQAVRLGKEDKVTGVPVRIGNPVPLADCLLFVAIRTSADAHSWPACSCDHVPYRLGMEHGDTGVWLSMTTTRLLPLLLCLALLLSGCGGGAMSLTEYTERINAVETRASEQGERIADEAEDIVDFTPQDLEAVLEKARVIRIEVKDATDDIEPPEQVADIHKLVFDWHSAFIATEEALAARAATTPHTDQGWTELSDSPEMAAYRAAIAEGKQVCNDFQSRLDATEQRGVFADTPWIPGEMKEVVERVLGCVWFPENPEDVYRYPPPDSTS